VQHALQRAKIDSPRKGAHQFRHTLASTMLQNGGSLSEIGELLRPRSPDTILANWYRSGQEPERRWPVLSTYLGPGHVSDTYWSLTICPELMGLVVKRVEKHWEDPS
jgi:hypothetical protein